MKPAPRPPAITAGTVPTAIAQAIRSSTVSIARLRRSRKKASGEGDHLVPEVGDRGDQRAGVQGDVEGLVERLVFLQERVVLEPGDEDQVPRGGDRQELREALDDPQKEGLQFGHRRGILEADRDRRARNALGPAMFVRLPGDAIRSFSRRLAAPFVLAHLRRCSPWRPPRWRPTASALYGRTDDKVITFFAFGVMAFFAILVIVLSLVQIRLDNRKERRKQDLERLGHSLSPARHAERRGRWRCRWSVAAR